MKKSILIVDEDKNFLLSFKYILERNNYIVHHSRTGKQALQLLQQYHFDGALIDLYLPDATGVELADYISRHFNHIAVVILTAKATLDSALYVLRSGGSDYLCKPVPPEIILSTLKRCIENSRLKQELSKSRQQFRQLAELTSEGIALIRNQTIYLVNNQLSDLFGYNKAVLTNMTIEQLLPDWHSSLIALQNLRQQGQVATVESRGKHKSGSIFPVEIRLKHLEDDESSIHAVSIMDISQRKINESKLLDFKDKLAKSKRMESLGLMASRVAHDLNNILSGLVSYPDLLLQKLGNDSTLKKEIELIRKSGQQAGDLVSDLLTVARGAKSRKEDNNLNLLISSYRNSIEYRQLHLEFPNLQIEFELDPTIPAISSSAINITQTLLNLIMNGAEACVDGAPQIRVRTTSQTFDKVIPGFEDIPPGSYVILSVTDNGKGIATQSRNHIFEPFYSEKKLGKSGTGLGLTVIWNTIRDHQGYINLATSRKGTRFDLYFPQSATRHQPPRSDSPLTHAGNGEHILVVDDEEFQQEIARNTLKQLGYNVQTVGSGEEALEIVRAAPVDLLVLDMVFESGMSGMDTYTAIKKVNPEQKALVTSGFVDVIAQEKITLLGINHYLHKPYSLDTMGRAIDQLLRSK